MKVKEELKTDVLLESEQVQFVNEQCNGTTDTHNTSQIHLIRTTDRGKPFCHLDDILSSLQLGQFHWRMLALVGGGYFSVCSEMMLFIFLSIPIKNEWSLGDMDFPWLPFR